MHAPKESGAAIVCANEGDPAPRFGQPTNAGNTWAGSGMQPILFEPDFLREVGLTIPQFLRNKRMERAAELLRSGRYNVTEPRPKSATPA